MVLSVSLAPSLNPCLFSSMSNFDLASLRRGSFHVIMRWEDGQWTNSCTRVAYPSRPLPRSSKRVRCHDAFFTLNTGADPGSFTGASARHTSLSQLSRFAVESETSRLTLTQAQHPTPALACLQTSINSVPALELFTHAERRQHSNQNLSTLSKLSSITNYSLPLLHNFDQSTSWTLSRSSPTAR